MSSILWISRTDKITLIAVRGVKGRLPQRDTRKLSEMMEMFCVLTGVVVIWRYLIGLTELYISHLCVLLYVSYALIKWILKSQYCWPLSNVVLNCASSLIHGFVCFFFSFGKYVLHHPWLIESVQAEKLIWSANCWVMDTFLIHGG